MMSETATRIQKSYLRVAQEKKQMKTEIEELRAERDRLKTELEVAQAFHDVAVKERDAVRAELARVRDEVRLSTIEECARVVEGWHIKKGGYGLLSDAIRALAKKDDV